MSTASPASSLRCSSAGGSPASSERRRGLARRVRWSWPWSATVTSSPARSRQQRRLALVERPAARGCRVERVGGERGQHGDQVRHAVLAQHLVEAGERLRAVAVRLGDRLEVRELVHAHQEARRAGRRGGESALVGQHAGLHQHALEHAHGRRRGHAASLRASASIEYSRSASARPAGAIRRPRSPSASSTARAKARGVGSLEVVLARAGLQARRGPWRADHRDAVGERLDELQRRAAASQQRHDAQPALA